MSIDLLLRTSIVICCVIAAPIGGLGQPQSAKTGSGGSDGHAQAGLLSVSPLTAGTAVAVAIGTALAVASSDTPGGTGTSTITATATTTRPR